MDAAEKSACVRACMCACMRACMRVRITHLHLIAPPGMVEGIMENLRNAADQLEEDRWMYE